MHTSKVTIKQLVFGKGLFRLIITVSQARLGCLELALPAHIEMLAARKTLTRHLPVFIFEFFIALFSIPSRLISVTKTWEGDLQSFFTC